MKDNIKSYIKNKYSVYPQTSQAVELQGKLCSVMNDVYDECRSKGLSECASFSQAILSIRV